MKGQPERITEAEGRQGKRDGRSPADQLKFLDKRLGKGRGAVRERARLKAQVKEAS